MNIGLYNYKYFFVMQREPYIEYITFLVASQ